MIAAIIPAHNEQEHIAACLSALKLAAACPSLGGEPVLLVVALDACSDATEMIARRMQATVVRVEARNVGIARAAAARVALDAGARWLAFTDADTVVSPNWLSAQLALGSDAVCGTVAVSNWDGYCERMRQSYDAMYVDADGHRHIHGANLGVSAEAYGRAGGFFPLHTSEDVALVKALEQSGASIAWSATPRVTTSARRNFRAPDGFGATLQRLEQDAAAVERAAA